MLMHLDEHQRVIGAVSLPLLRCPVLSLLQVRTACFGRTGLVSRGTARSSRSCPGRGSPDRHVSVSSPPQGGAARSCSIYLAHHSLSSP